MCMNKGYAAYLSFFALSGRSNTHHLPFTKIFSFSEYNRVLSFMCTRLHTTMKKECFTAGRRSVQIRISETREKSLLENGKRLKHRRSSNHSESLCLSCC